MRNHHWNAREVDDEIKLEGLIQKVTVGDL